MACAAWQAKAIYKHTPSLRKARRVQFSKEADMKGAYEFRKEPKENFLSTLESIAYCLAGLLAYASVQTSV